MVFQFFYAGITKFFVQRARMSCNSNFISHLPGSERIVWVDLEMTGLNEAKDQIIEMACLITDDMLNIVAEGPDIIIHQPDSILNAMDEWCQKHHGDSGLTKAVQMSKVSLQEAEMQMVSFVRQHTPRGKCPLAGNSVHVDKRFLEKYMPSFTAHLHYRIIDVSTIKELARRWYPSVYAAVAKTGSHRALNDIKESINELKMYRETIFRPREVW